MNVSFGKVIQVWTKKPEVMNEITDKAYKQKDKISSHDLASGDDRDYQKILIMTGEEKDSYDNLLTNASKPHSNTPQAEKDLFSLSELTRGFNIRTKNEVIKVNSVNQIQEKVFDRLA
jgi:hypothetical protein